MREKYVLLIFLVLSLGIFFRLFNLSQNPPGLTWDEVSIGYNAYSVLKTGRDEWGNFLPLSFKAFGEYKLPGYIYLDVPFIALFGLNEFGTRLPSAFLGIGTVIFIGLILQKLTSSKVLALWGLFFASILPWLVIFSRIALEANLALFLITAAFYFFIQGLDQRKYFPLSSLFLGLSLFSYNSSRVIVLPLLLSAFFIFRKQLSQKKQELFISLGILAVFITAALPLAFMQDSSARYRWTQIIDEGALAQINQLRGSSSFSPFFTELFYNKVTYFVPQAVKNYFSHFNPEFLFLNGGSNYQYSVPGTGLLPLGMLPLLILGILQIIRQKLPWQIFILGWLLIAPLPGAITRDAPHALRSLFLITPLIMITVLGVGFIQKYLRSGVALMLLAVIVITSFLSTAFFWQTYTGSYQRDYSWSWQYGYKGVMDYIGQYGDKYPRIVVSKKYGEPHIFTLFYLKIDPQKYLNDQNLVRYEKSNWWWVDRFDRFEFINDWEIKEKMANEHNLLLVTSPGNYPQRGKFLKTIYFLDSKSAFDIIEL